MTDSARPWCCPEPRCTPLHNHGDGGSLAEPRPGQSFTCLGRMDKSVAFTYDDVDHRNDLNRCRYTPLKGILRFQIAFVVIEAFIRWRERREDRER